MDKCGDKTAGGLLEDKTDKTKFSGKYKIYNYSFLPFANSFNFDSIRLFFFSFIFKNNF